MKRVCFLIQIKRERLQDYLQAHQVWPEMEQAIQDVGIRNYSMFFREDGMVVGYFEARDPEQSLRTLGQTDINRRWQAHMAEFFETTGDLRGQGIQWLQQYFYLD